MRAILFWLWDHITATGLAALAAGFSALSSLLIWRVQRNSFLESLRPELELIDWARVDQGDEAKPVTMLRSWGVMNVGRGAAFNAWLRVDHDPTGCYSMKSTHRLPTIAANQKLPLPTLITIRFSNAPADIGAIAVPLRVSCTDSRGNVYDTLCQLDVLRETVPLAGTYTIARNVTVTRRTTLTTARQLHLRAGRNRLLLRLYGIPGLRRLLPRQRR